MNSNQENIRRAIPPGIKKNIMMTPANALAANGEGIDSMMILSNIVRKLEILEKRINALAAGGKNVEQPGDATAGNGQASGRKNGVLPSFINGSFQKDFKERPAESVLNLIADMQQGMPESMGSKNGHMGEMMGMFKNISRQVRKDRLFEKFEDAREMIQEIEKIFKQIPEIEKRPDAYEIAYNLVKATLVKGGEQQKLKKRQETNADDEQVELREKKRQAFVEGKKSASPGKETVELTPAQREICKKLGINEKAFKKYLKSEEA